jgi:hypothetical protein
MADTKLKWVVKKEATNTVRTGTLSDADGPIDLTNKTVTLNVRRTPTSTPIIDNAAVTKAANQSTTGKGQISYTFTALDLDHEALTDGYLLEFKMVEGSRVDFVPTDEDGNRTYGRLIIQKSLDL